MHIYYMKDTSFEDCDAPKNDTWVIKKVLESKKVIMQTPGLQGNLQRRLNTLTAGWGEFSIENIYTAMLPQLPKAPWKSILLQASIHPRHNFILRIALLKRLATVDKLAKFGIIVDDTCVFCSNAVETQDHLIL